MWILYKRCRRSFTVYLNPQSLQRHAIVCTDGIPHFAFPLCSAKIIISIFVASCYMYLKDISARYHENNKYINR